MKFSLLHPSRNRAAEVEPAIKEWRDKCSGLHPVEYIVSVDNNDGQLEEYRAITQRLGVELIVNPNRTHVEASNRAAQVATGDLLLQISDDFGCPQDWDTALVNAIGERRDITVLVDDGLGAKTMTLPIMDRAFYERVGYVLHPGYSHMFCDNDLEELSRQLGKLVEAKHLLFPHRHYTVGAVPFDETYRKAASSWGRDARFFAKRQVIDFGLRPKTVRDTLRGIWMDLCHYCAWGRKLPGRLILRFRAQIESRRTQPSHPDHS